MHLLRILILSAWRGYRWPDTFEGDSLFQRRSPAVKDPKGVYDWTLEWPLGTQGGCAYHMYIHISRNPVEVAPLHPQD